jgi:peptidoglycan hydrolase-like protein with peptidoglycan-binding domain
MLLAAALPLGAVMAGSGVASASSCNNPSVGSWTSNCTVSDGMANNYVEAVQTVVNAWVYVSGHTTSCTGLTVPLQEDGDFGPQTLAAVECFQKYNSLSVDGTVGPATWTKLGNDLKEDSCQGNWCYYDPKGTGGEDFEIYTPTDVWSVYSNDISAEYHHMDLSGPQ